MDLPWILFVMGGLVLVMLGGYKVDAKKKQEERKEAERVRSIRAQDRQMREDFLASVYLCGDCNREVRPVENRCPFCSGSVVPKWNIFRLSRIMDHNLSPKQIMTEEMRRGRNQISCEVASYIEGKRLLEEAG